jgi:multidrug efflux system outer membrane protein
MKARLIAILMAAIVLASCRVGPKYVKPAIPVPDAFRGAEPLESADTTSLANLKWFEVFKDQELQRLIRTALAENYNLRDAVARVDAARFNLRSTKANTRPAITAGTGVSTSRTSASGSVPLLSGFDQNRTFGSVSLDLLSYEADVWGRLRSTTDAAQAGLLASEENRKVVVTTLVSDVAGAYFNLLDLDSELDIARRTLKARQDSLHLIQTRQAHGLATLLEVRQGEQLVYSAERTIPRIEEAIEQRENQISLLLGHSPGEIARGDPLEMQEQPPCVPVGLPSELLERRPDIRLAEQGLVQANAMIGVAKAAYFPRISLTGLLGFQSSQLSSLFTGATGIWQFVPQVSQPIFTGGRLRANVDMANAQQQLALIEYERVIQTSFREVSDSLIQYQKVRETRGKQESLVETLEDRSRLSYMRYNGGVDTLLSALDADRDLFDAELGLVQIKRDELLSMVQLYRALGGGWQE